MCLNYQYENSISIFSMYSWTPVRVRVWVTVRVRVMGYS